jgi:hypothetical protein
MKTLPHPDDIAAREAMARRPQPRAQISPWTPADKELPGNMRCVLATDIEAHFVAIYEDGTWIEASTSEPIDSHITHWMELPEVPE